MIRRAAVASLALLATALGTSVSSAQRTPPAPDPPAEAAPSLATPPALAAPAEADPSPIPSTPPEPAQPPRGPGPLYPAAPPGWAWVPAAQPYPGPWPYAWGYGAWRPIVPDLEQLPLELTPDPLRPTGVTLGSAGLVSAAIGFGWLVSARSGTSQCGLSGCIELADRPSQNSAAALLGGGVSAAVFGAAIFLVGAKSLAPPRKSNTRMITGLSFTTLGLSTIVAGMVLAVQPYPGRGLLSNEVFPPGTDVYNHQGGEALVLTLLGMSCIAVGIPLWVSGARGRRGKRGVRADASSLDLLPSAGGAALRWTR